jgi:AcrR family transcriptional regulator
MPKIIDHEQYRNELLSKCFDIFARRGYATLTMRELAAELKVSTGTLYHYWAGKQEIFEAFVLYLGEKDRAAFFQSAGRPGSLKERLEVLLAYVKANEGYFLKQFFIGMDYFRVKGEELIHNEVMKRSNEMYRKGFAEYLEIDDQEVITFILSMVTGTVIGRMYEGELVSVERQGRMLTGMLQQYLESKSNRG